jgi:hypothetical protein
MFFIADLLSYPSKFLWDIFLYRFFDFFEIHYFCISSSGSELYKFEGITEHTQAELMD